MELSKVIQIAALSISGMLASVAHAAPVELSWVSTGQAGDWTVEFTVHNNLQPGAADMSIYGFGVYTAARDIVGSPTGWDPDYSLVRTDPYAFYPYNNNWLHATDSGVIPGTSVSGFQIRVTTQDSPTTFSWYAYAASPTDGLYTGTGQTFGGSKNPAFQITTVQAAVPEPGTFAMLLSAAALVASWKFTRRPTWSTRT